MGERKNIACEPLASTRAATRASDVRWAWVLLHPRRDMEAVSHSALPQRSGNEDARGGEPMRMRSTVQFGLVQRSRNKIRARHLVQLWNFIAAARALRQVNTGLVSVFGHDEKVVPNLADLHPPGELYRRVHLLLDLRDIYLVRAACVRAKPRERGLF